MSDDSIQMTGTIPARHKGLEKITESNAGKPKKEFPIRMVELEALKPHEALVHDELDAFVRSVTTGGIFYKPALVALPDYFIIDGHHRWAGLKKLGAKKMPCILLKYEDNPDIRLETWYPLIKGSLSQAIAALETEQNIRLEYVKTLNSALQSLVEKRASFAIVDDEKEGPFILVEGDAKKILETLEKTDGIRLEFIDAQEGALKEAAVEGTAAMLRIPITKKEVIEMVKSGKVFAPKTTRHVLSFVYQDINVKLEDLM